jgi:hypothetical protein
MHPLILTAIAASIVWEVDGVEVHRGGDAEAVYQASRDMDIVFLPRWGRNAQLYWRAGDVAPGAIHCARLDQFSILTADNGYGGLDRLPAVWKDLSFGGCGLQSQSGDTVTTSDLTVEQLGPERVAGRFALEVAGAGPLTGSSLRVYVDFALAAAEQD